MVILKSHTFAGILKTKLKKMKKLILSAAIVIAAIGANAQMKKAETKTMKKFDFSIGAELGLPVGTNFSNYYTFGVGGTAQGDINVANDLAITIQAGYITYLAKSVTIAGVSYKGSALNVIPIMGGIKKKFSDGKVYASAQLGTGIFTGGGSSDATFAYAPGIGYYFSPNFDVLLKYQGYSKNSTTYSTVGLRLAYTIGAK